jgi:hypothetical protein
LLPAAARLQIELEDFMRTLISALLLPFFSSAASATADRYDGICDGSAAVALGADHFIVANDDGDILTIYRRREAAPVGEVDLIDFLGNRDDEGNNVEADIEGAARIGNRIYWIASHGRDLHGALQETRRVFFATDVVPGSPSPSAKAAGAPYRNLVDDLRHETRFATLGLAAAIDAEIGPEKEGGFNIEGLAATPEGHLLIAFRNPLHEGRAIVVTLENPDTLVRGEKAHFGDHFLLDLGGRGIRSIERIGNRYAIVAGPYFDASQGGPASDFVIFTWSGRAADAPAPIVQPDLEGMGPEALFAFEGSDDAYILSDDGDVRIGGKKCKNKKVPVKNKRFRGLPLKLE